MLAQAAVRDVDSSEFCSTSMVAPRREVNEAGLFELWSVLAIGI
jgi:hypothetical protein